MPAPTAKRWTPSRPPGAATAHDPFTPRLDEIIDLIRSCALEPAHMLATRVGGEARSAGNDVAAGRASSFLGEIAGIRGQLEVAMLEYGTAIEHLERTDLAGSISRAYRGWAYCYLMFRMPRLALQPAREARRVVELIDVRETRDRASFESAICEGLVQIELQNAAEAEAHWRSVDELLPRMAAVDDWLPGLYNLLGGRILVERGASEGDWKPARRGFAALEDVVKHFRESGLRFWQAWALEILGRAREEDDRGAAVRCVREALVLYREIGAEHLAEGAEQWLRAVVPSPATRYREAPAVARSHRLAPDVQIVETQFLAGPKTRELVERAMRFAQLVHPVLVLGESGTGKEGIAEIIHRTSPSRTGELVPINCASIPPHLLESVLFGHRKGAFTGATANNPGLIRNADGGTLFLDEIGELPLDLQPKLLRFLETGRTLAIGDTVERAVDVRIVAATNRNLEEAVSQGRFREDLYYRLNVLRINTIPLRERMEEVPRLAQHIAAGVDAKLTIGALNALAVYDWPGNVRQLKNVLFRAQGGASGPHAVIGRAAVEESLAAEAGPAGPARRPGPSAGADAAPGREPSRGPAPAMGVTAASADCRWEFRFIEPDGCLPPGMKLTDAEREFQRYHIARALALHNGNKTRAARDLGLKLQTLHVRARKLGLG